MKNGVDMQRSGSVKRLDLKFRPGRAFLRQPNGGGFMLGLVEAITTCLCIGCRASCVAWYMLIGLHLVRCLSVLGLGLEKLSQQNTQAYRYHCSPAPLSSNGTSSNYFPLPVRATPDPVYPGASTAQCCTGRYSGTPCCCPWCGDTWSCLMKSRGSATPTIC